MPGCASAGFAVLGGAGFEGWRPPRRWPCPASAALARSGARSSNARAWVMKVWLTAKRSAKRSTPFLELIRRLLRFLPFSRSAACRSPASLLVPSWHHEIPSCLAHCGFGRLQGRQPFGGRHRLAGQEVGPARVPSLTDVPTCPSCGGPVARTGARGPAPRATAPPGARTGLGTPPGPGGLCWTSGTPRRWPQSLGPRARGPHLVHKNRKNVKDADRGQMAKVHVKLGADRWRKVPKTPGTESRL